MSLRKSAKVAIAGGVLALGLVGAGTAMAVSGGDGGSVSGPDADHARAAAVAVAPGGQAGPVRAESGGGAAYGVDVTQPDGTRLDVRLDRNFAVLGSQPGGQDTGGGDGGDGGDGDGG